MANIPINVGDTQEVNHTKTGASGYCDFAINKHAPFQIQEKQQHISDQVQQVPQSAAFERDKLTDKAISNDAARIPAEIHEYIVAMSKVSSTVQRK